MPLFPSPRKEAGRGRVRGLGKWPHLFNCAPILQMTICSTEQPCRFKQSGYSPRPLTRPLPTKRRREENILSRTSIAIARKAENLDGAVNHHFDQLRARPVEG